ncbi:MAG: response regulator [Planctomycetales bacterium]|nr:response regulator [Planctomycetales bacterium]
MVAVAIAELPEVLVARRRLSILVIDDDQDQVGVLSHRLGVQGYRTFAAGSARYGLEVARAQRPDLILLDLRLPDADGFNVCQALTDDPETCCIPVIILSGMERPDIIRRSRAVGCQYFVRKPYDPNALLILIERAIDESHSWRHS